MSEAKVGDEFITHEFDEAIVVQQAIVEGATSLSTDHTRAETRRLIKRHLADEKAWLASLRAFGKQHGATGKVEGVQKALKDLMDETAGSAGEAASESYEAQAVLITLKRKQQDSAGAVLKIARELGDTELRDAALEMQKGIKAGAQELADDLALFAVEIATKAPATAGAAR